MLWRHDEGAPCSSKHVGSHNGVCETYISRITRRRDLDERTGRGVARTEGGELHGGLLREDDEVGLLVGGTVPSRRAAPYATACGCPQFSGGGHHGHASLLSAAGLAFEDM